MQGHIACEVCAAPLGSDSFFTPSGEQVCRRCYYAVQAGLEAERIENQPAQIGLFGAVHALKRLFVGGMLVLFGLAMTVSSLRHEQWSDAALGAGLLAMGVLVGWVTLARLRRGQR